MRHCLKVLLFTFVIALLAGCTTRHTKPEIWESAATAPNTLVRVTVTSQAYTFHRPWQQRRPITQTAIGVIVPGNRVLVTAMLVANHRYIELESVQTQKKVHAEVAVVDYEADLALLKPLDPSFLEGHRPMTLSASVASGERLTIWQVKPDGDVVPSTSRVTSVELSAYTQNNFFLTYRLNGSLQYAFNNQTLPVVMGNQLAGLVLRYDAGGQTIDVISTPVIQHFLKDAQNDPYQGFPKAGFHFGPTMDPQLRRYIGIGKDLSGIYVQKVIKGGPADTAGLQAGDVIIRMGEYGISNTGQYQHPLYGKTSLIHLIRTGYYVGDAAPLQVYRQGEIIDLNVSLDHRRPDQYLVPPYIVDQAPPYLIVGGLVFQELSVSYLLEYGKDWTSRAPVHLAYYNQNQDYLNGDQREKIVLISEVIPTPYSIGYEELNDLVVRKVNNQPIKKLDDVSKALQTPVDGFHKIEVDQNPRLLFLDPDQIDAIHKIIRERYRIPIPPLGENRKKE